MAYRFSKLPTGWTRTTGCDLASFKAAEQAGASIAALKCLLAVSLQMDFHSRSAVVSYNDFETLTGLSRPMIAKGIRTLEDKKILAIETAHTHRYTVNEVEDKNWAKIPFDLLSLRLRDLGNRGAVRLAALKIYVLLAARRNNNYDWTALTYEQICAHTGVRRGDIRAALSELYSLGLLHADMIQPDDGKQSFKAYFIRGLTIADPRLGRAPEPS
ncbi:hypothetical protein [Pseudomonas marginalis]|uniref:hypothetical protein n=1 Tax=Pseudomonas marginalis TaxID=298 RepID=UPI0005FB3B5F|nr:hypothetical protein [Pseudomonas marginalis]KJZ52487.1 replication protein [Pseudomonas marginalis]KJZ57126.1 replication protein [Pseudomonas marginalis]